MPGDEKIQYVRQILESFCIKKFDDKVMNMIEELQIGACFGKERENSEEEKKEGKVKEQ